MEKADNTITCREFYHEGKITIICIYYIYIWKDTLKRPRGTLNRVLVQLPLDGRIPGDLGIHFRHFCVFIVISSINTYYFAKNNHFQKKKKSI